MNLNHSSIKTDSLWRESLRQWEELLTEEERNETMATHSKTPWSYRRSGGYVGFVTAADPHGPSGDEFKAPLTGDADDIETTLHNAAFAVHAVNCHAELLAACEWMLAALDAHKLYRHDDPGLMLGRSAISKAKKGS